MSIEQDLNRIANALETMVKLMPAPAGQTVAIPAAEKKSTKKATPAADVQTPPAGAPVVAAAPEATAADPFAIGVEEPEVSIEGLLAALKMHALKFGNPSTLTLMKKHGANQTTPTIKSIPSVNYKPLMTEIKSDIEKLQAKG